MRGVPFVGRELVLASRTTAAGLLGAGRRDRGRTVAAAERCRAADLTSYSPPPLPTRRSPPPACSGGRGPSRTAAPATSTSSPAPWTCVSPGVALSRPIARWRCTACPGRPAALLKVGEDFHCPAGDWDGTGGGTDPDGEEDERPQQSWRRRKRRAVMSYDPPKVSAGDLHIVIEVFRAVRQGEDEGEPHDARPSRQEKDIGGKILRAAPPARRGPDGSPRARLQFPFCSFSFP